MTNKFTFNLALGTLIIVIIGLGTLLLPTKEINNHNYQRDMVVVDEDNGVLTLQDINGELWVIDNSDTYYDVQGYHLADTLVVYMDDNSTSHTIYDDIIVDVQPLVVNN